MIAQGFDDSNAAASEQVRAPYAGAEAEHPGAVVLLADPDPDSRVIFSTILRYRGFRPVAVARAEEVLRAARTVSPRVAILDLRLGWELVERFRGEAETGSIPVALLSAVDLGPERTRAREMGCAIFLSKPLVPSQLADEVRRLLEPAT